MPNPVLENLALSTCGLLAALTALGGAADAGSAHKTLLELGLEKKASYYIVADEVQLSRALRDVSKVESRLQRALQDQQRLQQVAAARRAELRGAIAERRRLNEQLSGVFTVLENNRLVGRINELNDRIRLLEEPADAARVQGELAAARAEYVDRVSRMRALVDGIRTRYAALGRDERVAAALAEINRAGTRQVTVGPRRQFERQATEVARLESAIHSQTIDLQEQSNVFEVRVLLNGRREESMVFDTGASYISLPYILAEDLGLRPSDDDPQVRTRMADGRLVDARKMMLESVALGRFEARDVDCLVLPADVSNAPPLLGGSFLRHFVYRVDPQGRKLTLTRVGARGDE